MALPLHLNIFVFYAYLESKAKRLIQTRKWGLKLPNFWFLECVEPNRLGVDMFVRNVKR